MAEELGSSSSSSKKHVKIMGIDRLSALPDSLLISILSLLSTEEAMRTSVLSRRWHFLWTDLPALAFRQRSGGDQKISKIVAGVHKYLAHCGGNHLQRFEVSFDYNERFASDLNAWVHFALKHKVKDVALLLICWRYKYLLPQMMYSNSYLTSLSLEGCIMAPKNTVRWGALSSLSLARVRFQENAIGKILSGCPVLHDLILERCCGSNCLNVKSQSLRKLTLIGRYSAAHDDGYFLEISTPFIHYAKISLYVVARMFRFSNLSSLVEADIDLQAYNNVMLQGYAKELFPNLHHVKKLKVGPHLILALGDLVMDEGLQLSLFGVECLQLNADILRYTSYGIVCLLESSPNLMALHISLCYYYFKDELKKVELNRDLLHLKTVTITVHEMPEHVAETMLTLVRLLLKRALVLEKLVINFSLRPLEYTKIAQTLLSFQRASAEVVVELSPVGNQEPIDIARPLCASAINGLQKAR